MNYENRYLPNANDYCELRSDDKCFSGYAARFYDPQDTGTTYRLSEELTERLASSAFERTIRDGHDIKLLVDHDPSACMGRTNTSRSAKLALWTDDKGLRFSCPYDGDDPDHRRMRAKIGNGSIAGCSFRFHTGGGKGERMLSERGMDWRELTDIDISEVSLVYDPAYPATNCDVRSALDNYETWKLLEENRAFIAKYGSKSQEASKV